MEAIPLVGLKQARGEREHRDITGPSPPDPAHPAKALRGLRGGRKERRKAQRGIWGTEKGKSFVSKTYTTDHQAYGGYRNGAAIGPTTQAFTA